MVCAQYCLLWFIGICIFKFTSVFGMFGSMYIPDILQGMHDSNFFCIASVSLGHQKCRAAVVILWPLCNRLIMVVRKFFGTMILFSIKTRPNQLGSFSYEADIHPVLILAVDDSNKPKFLARSDHW